MAENKANRMFTTRPFYSPRPWGYELWTLSTHRSGQSLVLPQEENLLEYLGKPLPILIKIIKADEALSVQVHPGDEYARIHENDKGKTECWYILEAKPDAKLIAGIKPGTTRETMAQALKDPSGSTVEGLIEYIDVKAGDMIFIPHGTVHAILGGLKLFEIQQSSDSTYRMYDWGRQREMHIEKALDVINYAGDNGAGIVENFTKLETPYFRVEKVVTDEPVEFKGSEGFQTINVCHGEGTIVSDAGQSMDIHPDETIYIPAGVGYTLTGSLEVLRTY